MDIIVLLLTIGLPLGKILLFPARAVGRGGNWTLVGAAMIVGLMMALWFGVQSFTDSASPALSGKAVASATSDVPAVDPKEIKALEQLLQ